MVHSGLIRKEPRVGGNYYELSHDALIAPIVASRRDQGTQVQTPDLVSQRPWLFCCGSITTVSLAFF